MYLFVVSSVPFQFGVPRLPRLFFHPINKQTMSSDSIPLNMPSSKEVGIATALQLIIVVFALVAHLMEADELKERSYSTLMYVLVNFIVTTCIMFKRYRFTPFKNIFESVDFIYQFLALCVMVPLITAFLDSQLVYKLNVFSNPFAFCRLLLAMGFDILINTTLSILGSLLLTKMNVSSALTLSLSAMNLLSYISVTKQVRMTFVYQVNKLGNQVDPSKLMSLATVGSFIGVAIAANAGALVSKLRENPSKAVLTEAAITAVVSIVCFTILSAAGWLDEIETDQSLKTAAIPNIVIGCTLMFATGVGILVAHSSSFDHSIKKVP